MRAITGAVVSSEPCTLTTSHDFLFDFCSTPDSYLASSDCATYILVLDGAIKEQHKFLRRRGIEETQQGTAHLGAHGYEGPVGGARERQGGEKNRDTEVPAGGRHGSVEEAKGAVADGEKSRKRKNEEGPYEVLKAVAGVVSHIPASPEILSEQRREKKEKHSNKELVCVVKQEPDLVVEEDGGSERMKKKKKEKHSVKELASIVKQEPDLVLEKDGGSERMKKKKEKHSDKEVASIVKQEPGLVVEEELGSEKKKGKKKKEKGRVKLEEDMVEVKGQIMNNGVAEQGGIADGEKKRKKKKHSEEEGDLKSVKQEKKMAADSDLNSEKKKKKKRGREDDDDTVQEQGEHKKKKQRKES